MIKPVYQVYVASNNKVQESPKQYKNKKEAEKSLDTFIKRQGSKDVVGTVMEVRKP